MLKILWRNHFELFVPIFKMITTKNLHLLKENKTDNRCIEHSISVHNIFILICQWDMYLTYVVINPNHDL